MSTNNSKSKAAPVVILRQGPSGIGRTLLKLVPSVIGSVLLHAILVGAFVAYHFIVILTAEAAEVPQVEKEVNHLKADPPDQENKKAFDVVDEDPAEVNPTTDIQYEVKRIEDFSVPGEVKPNDAIGIKDGNPSLSPINLPAPGGIGGAGQGGALESFSGIGNSNAPGELGGYTMRGMPLDKPFGGRSGSTREYALKNGGGTEKSEAAVARGLKWLIRLQMKDGKWMLNSPDLPPKDRGHQFNDTAGTALGVLPFLAAGMTHKPGKDNPHDKNINNALNFLIRSQDAKGYLGGSMYGHGLATIALCEAYGLTQDYKLRKPAQAAINLILNSQHQGGGWRYEPVKAGGDMSISGWQIMALKSGQMAGLDVPKAAIDKAINFLEHCYNPADHGYGYAGKGSSPTMSAVGLLCRQYMQSWGPAEPRMINGVSNFLKEPVPNNVYYNYYATQVMRHYGGESWKKWNDKMRDHLVDTQDKNPQSASFGSWPVPSGDTWGGVGGRLMVTSLNLLTLEVYYRYLPLFGREAGYSKDQAVQNALK